MKEIINRINQLVRLVKYYDYMLHIKGKTLISDEIYDAMRRELEDLEGQYPNLIREDSPSLYIGCISNSCNRTITRNIPMLSLRHTYNEKDILKFVDDVLKIDESIVIEPKIDGVAVSLHYIDGILDSMSLRGDGYQGEDISHFSPCVQNVLLQINDFNGEIRGEVIAPRDKITENNRNYVAGCLRRKGAKDFGLIFYPYKIINTNFSLQTECLEFLKKHMKIAHYKMLKNIDNLFEFIDEVKNHDFEFFIDGVVLKMNNLKLGESLGITHRYPREALAYKFSSKPQQTKVVSIDWSIRRNGVLTPVCVLEPISIDGSKITKVSGHNKRYLQTNQTGKGTIVSISRVGDVIPQISAIISSSEFEDLELCPFCQSSINTTDINYICSNQYCREKIFQCILYFFEKLKIDGLSHGIIRRFLKQDIDTLDNFITHLNSKTWIVDKNDLNTYEKWILKRKNIKFEELLIAMGIEGISDGYILELQIEQPEDLLGLKEKTGKKFELFSNFIEKNYDLIQKLWKLIKQV